MNEGYRNNLPMEFGAILRMRALISSHVFKISWEIFPKMWEIQKKKSVVF